MITFLLDVNVLLALTDPRHLHHEAAHRWFAEHRGNGWATCPLTENGFVRIASHPRYPNRPGDAAVVLGILRQFCALPGHRFWAADVSLRELVPPNTVLTHAQVIDVYLLGLAQRRGGMLATFDQGIAARTLPDGAGALEVIRI